MSKPALLAFAGLIGAGKSFAAAHLCARHGFTKLSFADPLREMLLKLDPWIGADSFVDYRPERLSSLLKEYGGWDALKTTVWKTEVREWLQKLGTDIVRKVSAEYFRGVMSGRVYQTEGAVVIDDCRFKNEAAMVQNYKGKVIYITHVNALAQCDRHSSEFFKPEWADEVIENDGTEKFLETVSELIET